MLLMPETTEHRQLEIEKILTSIDLNRRVVLNTPQLLIGPQYLTEFNLTMGLIVSKPLPAIEALRDLVVGINLIQHNRTLNSPMPHLSGSKTSLWNSQNKRANENRIQKKQTIRNLVLPRMGENGLGG